MEISGSCLKKVKGSRFCRTLAAAPSIFRKVMHWSRSSMLKIRRWTAVRFLLPLRSFKRQMMILLFRFNLRIHPERTQAGLDLTSSLNSGSIPTEMVIAPNITKEILALKILHRPSFDRSAACPLQTPSAPTSAAVLPSLNDLSAPSRIEREQLNCENNYEVSRSWAASKLNSDDHAEMDAINEKPRPTLLWKSFSFSVCSRHLTPHAHRNRKHKRIKASSTCIYQNEPKSETVDKRSTSPKLLVKVNKRGVPTWYFGCFSLLLVLSTLCLGRFFALTVTSTTWIAIAYLKVLQYHDTNQSSELIESSLSGLESVGSQRLSQDRREVTH